MDQGAKIAAAVVGGYILGRRRRAKLAIALGLYLAGKRLDIDPRQLANTLLKQLGDSPQVAALREQAQGELASVGKAAVGALVDRQANHFADMLHSRSEQLRTGTSGEPEETAEEEEPDEPAAEATEEEEPAEEKPRRRAPARSRSTSSRGGSSRGGTTRRTTQRRRSGGSES